MFIFNPLLLFLYCLQEGRLQCISIWCNGFDADACLDQITKSGGDGDGGGNRSFLPSVLPGKSRLVPVSPLPDQ